MQLAGSMEDNELVAACLEGRGEEFRKIVDIYKGPVMAAAMNVLGNREDAEDVCQQTFVAIFRNLGNFDQKKSFKSWMFAILYRRCLDAIRKRKRFERAFERIKREVEIHQTLVAANPGRDGQISKRILEQLNPKERTAVTLWANEGFTSAEISDVLRCSASTARVYLYNARKKIKSIMEKKHAACEVD
jgi:RNA polymerase sigma-70 factor (ECF subfamily)